MEGSAGFGAGQLALADSRLALIFLRYLGCPICRETLEELSKRYLEIASRGVEVWVFVPSAEEAAREYVQKHKLPYRLISDPDRQIYKLYGVEEDRFYTKTLKHLSGRELLRTAKLTLKHGHGLPEGSERQRLGAFLIDEHGFLAQDVARGRDAVLTLAEEAVNHPLEAGAK